jgi:hypothetical protein
VPDVIINEDITMHIHEVNPLKGNDSTLHKILFLFCPLCIITNLKMFKIHVTRLCVRSNREMHVVVCNVWVVGLSVMEDHLIARPKKMMNIL